MKNNNYPNWLVSLEIAKELKEIGFDIPCAFVLTNKNRIGFTTNESNQYHLFEELNLNSNSESSLVCIPTYEQVFEWFRDRKYYGTLNTYKDGFSFYCEINYNNQYIKVYSKTYEEAREELVKTLIQTYKSEQL